MPARRSRSDGNLASTSSCFARWAANLQGAGMHSLRCMPQMHDLPDSCAACSMWVGTHAKC